METASAEERSNAYGCGGARLRWRDLVVLVALTLLVRVTFLAVAPSGVVSTDLSQNWNAVVRALAAHQNPYNTTSFLNWPPFWMQTLFVLHKVADAWHVPFERAVQGFLIVVELLGLTAAGGLCRELEVPRRASLVALGVGVVANPIAVLVSCQHCNFDPVVGALAAAALLAVVRFARDADVVTWLVACACVGLAILVKTVPFVLAPFLVAGARKLPRLSWGLGTFLVLFPVTLGMSIVYALGPEEVTRNVLEYRSASGWFGVTGLLQLEHHEALIAPYTRAFTDLLLLSLAVLSVLFARRVPVDRRLFVLAAAMLLVGVPALGPGYGPQYMAWSIPLLAVSAAAFDGAWRWVLAAALLVGAGTYVIEYGLFPSHGAMWMHLPNHPPSAALARASAEWSTQAGQTKVRLPLFLSMLVVVATGGWTIKALPKQAIGDTRSS